MKIGVITQTNSKGQLVIPKQMRQALGIDPNVALNLVLKGSGIYMYPVEEVLTKEDKDEVYLEILKKTQGSWAGDNWDKTSKRRRQIELAASAKRKKAW